MGVGCSRRWQNAVSSACFSHDLCLPVLPPQVPQLTDGGCGVESLGGVAPVSAAAACAGGRPEQRIYVPR